MSVASTQTKASSDPPLTLQPTRFEYDLRLETGVKAKVKTIAALSIFIDLIINLHGTAPNPIVIKNVHNVELPADDIHDANTFLPGRLLC